MKTNFDKTAQVLGEAAAWVQEANRWVIVVVGALRGPVGLTTFILGLFVMGAHAATNGYANIVHHVNMMDARAVLGSTATDAEVFAYAHQEAWWEGAIIMLAVSCIVFFCNMGQEQNAHKLALGLAIVEGVMGGISFLYAAALSPANSIYAMGIMIIGGTLFRIIPPIVAHILCGQLRKQHGHRILAYNEVFTQLLDSDFEQLTK